MSQKKELLLIEPGKWLHQTENRETVKTNVYPCSYCGGRGFFPDYYDTNAPGTVCKVCEGKKDIC